MTDDTDSNLIAIFTGGGIIFAGLVLKQFIAFAATLIIARGLGPIDYGAVSIGITIMTTLSLITVLGLHTGISRYLPRFDDARQQRGVLVSAFQVALPISIIVGLSVVAFSGLIANSIFNDPALAPILQIFGLVIPFASLLRLCVGGIRGMKRSLPKVYIEYITLPLARFVFAAIALLLGFRAVGIAWAYLIAYVIAAGLALYLLIRHTAFLSNVQAESMHIPLLTFSLPLVISSAMDLILSDIDTFILAYYWNSGEVGIYNVAYPLGQVITIAVTAFGFLFLPIISDLHSEGKLGQMDRIYSIGTKWLFIITFPAFMVVSVFPDTIIGLTFGAEYTPGAIALSILAFGFTVHTIAGFNSSALTAIGNTRLIMYDNLLAAALNLTLNILLIPQYSFVGAAVATAISYIFLNTLYSYHLYGQTGIHPFSRSLLRIAIPSVLLGGILLLTSIVLEITLFFFILLISSFALVYLIFLLRSGIIQEEEVLMISHLEERIGVDLSFIKKLAD